MRPAKTRIAPPLRDAAANTVRDANRAREAHDVAAAGRRAVIAVCRDVATERGLGGVRIKSEPFQSLPRCELRKI